MVTIPHPLLHSKSEGAHVIPLTSNTHRSVHHSSPPLLLLPLPTSRFQVGVMVPLLLLLLLLLLQ